MVDFCHSRRVIVLAIVFYTSCPHIAVMYVSAKREKHIWLVIHIKVTTLRSMYNVQSFIQETNSIKVNSQTCTYTMVF